MAEKEARPSSRPERMAYMLLFTVSLIALIAVVSTWGAASGSPGREVMQASLQLLVVGVVGSLVTFAFGRIQRVEDDHRKKVEASRADERRVDETVLKFSDQMWNAYNGVKHTRRLLEAEVRLHQNDRPAGGGAQPALRATVSREAYKQLMSDLCERQLQFEALKKRAAILQVRVSGAEHIEVERRERKAARSDRPVFDVLTGAGGWESSQTLWEAERLSLEEICGRVEHHLNEVIEEYQKNLGRVPSGGVVELFELKAPSDIGGPVLPVFIFDTVCFRAQVTRYVDAVSRELDRHLLRIASRPA